MAGFFYYKDNQICVKLEAMKRCLALLILLFAFAPPAVAQMPVPATSAPAKAAVPAAPVAAPAAAGKIDIRSLGKPIEDDTASMYDRYVYFDGNTVAKNVPLYHAVLTHLDIQDWLVSQVAQLLTLDGSTYQQQVTISQQAFTPKGYGAYRASLDGAQIPQLLTEQGYKLQSMAKGTPVITSEGVRRTSDDPADRGVYTWQAELDATLTYIHAGEETAYPVVLVVELIRIPSREDGTLIAIDGWRFGQHEDAAAKEKERPLGRF